MRLMEPFCLEGMEMTKTEKQQYSTADALRTLLTEILAGKKFKLDCGHHFTGGEYLGNDITIRQGPKRFKIVCSQCGYCGY